MKYTILIAILMLTVTTICAQNPDIWIAFPNTDSTLIGFKDRNGTVRISPRFTGFTTAQKFSDIMGVTEEIEGKWESYYLTKSGKKIGKDSLYVFDNSPDCESEGYIRFRDHQTDKTGLFDRNGNIVIPAEYNDLTSVRNGLIVARKDAVKEYLKGGEYYAWTGGKYLLIDTLNQTLIEDFRPDGYLDFYSVKRSDSPVGDSLRQEFSGTDGRIYSFTDLGKEFRSWFTGQFLRNLSEKALLSSSYDRILTWAEHDGWQDMTKAGFIDRNFEILKERLSGLATGKYEYQIFRDGLNRFIYDSEEYDPFFNHCGEPQDWVYPVQSVVISHRRNEQLVQDHFDFLRTNDGYKLIAATIRPER